MRSTQTSPVEQGFSLLELLISLTVISIVMASAGALFVATRNYMQDQILGIETQQGLRSVLESIARDLRLGGACLPTAGDFAPLDGVEAGTLDQITTRTGLVRPNLSCVSTTTTANMTTTTTSIPVNSASGFAVGMRALIQGITTGESFTITGVNTGTNTIQKSGNWSQAYPSGSGVYALDERTYAVDTSNSQLPVLTIAANGAAASPFAAGVESFIIQYQLARNCPPCDVVTAPASASSDWRLVNQIFITATVRSSTTARNGQYIRRTGTISAKPRNLLPG